MTKIAELYGAFATNLVALKELEIKGGSTADKSGLEKQIEATRDQFEPQVAALQDLMRAELRRGSEPAKNLR